MGVFTNILKKEYPSAYATTWKADFTLNTETTDAEHFETADKEPTILQQEGMGVARFHNQGRKAIEILDFEAFVNLFTQKLRAGQGKKCDFILTDEEGKELIVFNEISKLSSESLRSFPQQADEKTPQNKIEKSFEQLKQSIERLCVSETLASHIAGYAVRTGLFSYRLTEPAKHNAATNAMLAFLTPLKRQPAFTAAGILPKGFTYQRREYPHAFEL